MLRQLLNAPTAKRGKSYDSTVELANTEQDDITTETDAATDAADTADIVSQIQRHMLLILCLQMTTILSDGCLLTTCVGIMIRLWCPRTRKSSA